MATPLETRTYDILADSGAINHKDITGSRYVDLGALPTVAEQRAATVMQTDDPPLDDPRLAGPSQQRPQIT